MNAKEYMEFARPAMNQITGSGAFLTALADDKVNTMTIGWASIGFIWGRPIMTVAVRKSRHTHSIIEKAADFTVSIPTIDMAKELEFCGTRSGRECDKLAGCNLEKFPSRSVHTPLVRVPGIHYECKIVFKAPMDPANLVESYHALYPKKDFHTLYFGEIVQAYSAGSE
jgi:flavin reductase (DIM6/NTAB) family NADH-FMN oxidoreductase RutF